MNYKKIEKYITKQFIKKDVKLSKWAIHINNKRIVKHKGGGISKNWFSIMLFNKGVKHFIVNNENKNYWDIKTTKWKDVKKNIDKWFDVNDLETQKERQQRKEIEKLGLDDLFKKENK